MPRIVRPLALAALLSGAALPAAADITPAEVWADWQSLIESYGPTISVGRSAETGSGLTLTDVALSYEFPDDAGRFAATIPEIVFADRGDGTVAITLAAEYPLAFEGTDATTGETFSFTMLARQPGLVTIASHDGDTTRYDYAGAEIGASITSFAVDDEPIDLDVDIVLSGLDGSYQIVEGDPRRFASRMEAGGLAVAASGADPETPDATFRIAMTLADLTSTGAGTIASLAGLADLSSMMAAGFESEWDVSHGPATYSASGVDAGSSFTLSTSAENGTLFGSLGPDGLVYGGGNSGIELSVSSSDMPFPELGFSMTEAEGRLEMPVAPADAPGDFGLRLRLVGLEAGETLWNMFDPAGQLPRDPASLVLDLAGKARWLVDVFDPDVAESLGPDAVPGEVESLTVEALELSIAGASLTGEGEFAFDNSGNGPFAPAPSPSGRLDLRLVGANGLMDTLVAMGLLPEEQAMGARMMLGLFARPGDGADTLVSTIEVGEDGSISANGQRFR